MILPVIFILFFILYSFLIIYYWISWRAIPDFKIPDISLQLRISVIIPARNEEKNIARLLESLSQQTYPAELVEVIVIDDHSTDNTASIVRQFNFVKLIQLPEVHLNSYKKKAIETGIAAASGELIVTTDADCKPTQNWLKTLVAFKIEKKAVFIAAPVVLECNSSVLEIFQSMDFMMLQGITGASVYKNTHSMCNGANLAYEKKIFQEVNGFAGIDHIASGDDMLLMFKIWKKYPGKVYYLKSQDAIVASQPMKTWKEFFNQRIRWASKAITYDDKRIIVVLFIVYLFNFLFLVLLITGCWIPEYWFYLLAVGVAKTLVELPLFLSVADFFNKRWAVKLLFFFQPLHITYTIISGLFGQFGKYEWKGRRVK